MRVLLITNFFPYISNQSRGIFIFNRLKEYKKLNLVPKVIGIAHEESKILRLIKKIVNKNLLIPATDFEDVKYEYVFMKRDLSSVFFHRLLLTSWIKKLITNTADSLMKKLTKEKFNLIHAHGMFLPIPAGIVAWNLSKIINIPYIVTVHGSDINYQMKHRKLRNLYIEALEKASKVIFVSNQLLERAKSYGYSGKNSIVIPNGFDPRIFFPKDKKQVRQELGIFKGKTKYVGYVGGLKYVKRSDKLPEIFYQIANKIPDTKFIIVGDGELRNKIEKETVKLKLDILFTGNISQDKVAKYMNAMDVMILPSRNEGWPCVVLEAQACGTCVVGSNNGGIPEAIGFDEHVVEDGEDFENRFALKVVDILNNGYDREMLIGRAQDFTWEKIVEREIAVYKEIILNT